MVDQVLTEEQRAENRLVGEHFIGRLEGVAASASEQLIKISGWLTASLLAINGGGAIATLNAGEHLSDARWPGALFAIGIALAMLNAYAIQVFQAKSATPIENLLGYWRNVQIYGERNISNEEAYSAPLLRMNRWSWIPPVIGWGSAILFFAGVIELGLNVKQSDIAAPAHCIALQRDMLSSHPRRRDSRELFVALNCRDTGTGAVYAPN